MAGEYDYFVSALSLSLSTFPHPFIQAACCHAFSYSEARPPLHTTYVSTPPSPLSPPQVSDSASLDYDVPKLYCDLMVVGPDTWPNNFGFVLPKTWPQLRKDAIDNVIMGLRQQGLLDSLKQTYYGSAGCPPIGSQSAGSSAISLKN